MPWLVSLLVGCRFLGDYSDLPVPRDTTVLDSGCRHFVANLDGLCGEEASHGACAQTCASLGEGAWVDLDECLHAEAVPTCDLARSCLSGVEDLGCL